MITTVPRIETLDLRHFYHAIKHCPESQHKKTWEQIKRLRQLDSQLISRTVRPQR